MTMRSLDHRREGFHRIIRHQQLEMRFEQQRMLLREVEPGQVRDIVGNSLVGLQRAFEEENQPAIIFHLTQLRSIIQQYLIADFLLCQMRLSPEMEAVRQGRIGMDCTVIDLFLILLGTEDEAIREHASALIQHSLEQMRLILPKKIHNKHCEEQVKRVMDQFPPQLLSDYNIRVALHSLSAMQELLLTPNCHQTLPYLLGIYPHFLQSVVALFQHPHSINVEGYSEKVVDLCLLILYVTSEITYFDFLPEMQAMKRLIKGVLVQKIVQGEFSRQLFNRIRALSLCRVALKRDQLQYILQGTLLHELNNKNTEYLEMLAAVLQTNQELLPPEALYLLFNALLKPISENNQDELQHSRWLAIVVYKSTPILKDMLRRDIDLVIQGWKEPLFSQQMASLVNVAFKCSEALFHLLLEICRCFYEAVPFLTPILNNTFAFLDNYNEWRILLQNKPLLCE